MIIYKPATSLMDYIRDRHNGIKLAYANANNTTAQRVNVMTPADGVEEEKPMFIVIGNDLYRLAKENIK